MEWFVFFLNLAGFVLGRYLDIVSSVGGKYYGLKESNRLWDNGEGDIDAAKNLIVSAIIGGAVLVPAAIWDPYASCILLPFTAGSIFIYFRNMGMRKKNRERQIKCLRQIRDALTYDQWPNMGWPATNKKNGHTYYEIFRYVYSTKPTNGPEGTAPAIFDMQGKLEALAKGPESEWFPK